MRRMNLVSTCLTIALPILTILLWPVPGQAAKIKLGYHRGVFGAVDLVADKKGYFKKAGVDVDAKRMNSGRAMRSAVIAGSLDIASISGSSFVIGAGKKAPVTAIALGYYYCKSVQFLVKPNSPIKGIKDLKGKKIAIGIGSNAENVFETKMAPPHGFGAGGYENINLKYQDRISALTVGNVDAIVSIEPYTSIALHKKLARTITDVCAYDNSAWLLFAHNSIVKNNPDGVVKYLKGWLMAADLYKKNFDEFVKIYWTSQKDQGYKIERTVVAKLLKNVRLDPPITPALRKYLEEQVRTNLKRKKIKKAPNLGKFIRTDFIKKAMAAN